MGDTLITFAWTIGGGLALGTLGALFGALARWLSWKRGETTGTGLGRRVARALARLAAEEPSPGAMSALSGAVDGAMFLGVVGILVGLLAREVGHAPAAWLVPLFLACLFMILGAVSFGILAAGILRQRVYAVAGVFFGGITGALVAAFRFGTLHIVPGAVVGIFLGAFVGLLLPRRR